MSLRRRRPGRWAIGLAVAGAVAAGCGGRTDHQGTTSSAPQPFPITDCQEDATVACPSDAVGMSCGSSTAPQPDGVTCGAPMPNPDGTYGFCCTLEPASPCTLDPSVPGCAFPSQGFSCGGSSPDTSDPSLRCGTPTLGPNGDFLYCCASTSGCAGDPSLACGPGTYGVTCLSGHDPVIEFPGYVCSAASPQPDAAASYCCATGFDGSTCAQDATVQGCAYPSVGFSCTGSDTPEQADPALTCSDGVTYTTGNTLYCCQ